MYGHSVQVFEHFETCTDTVRSVRSGGYAHVGGIWVPCLPQSDATVFVLSRYCQAARGCCISFCPLESAATYRGTPPHSSSQGAYSQLRYKKPYRKSMLRESKVSSRIGAECLLSGSAHRTSFQAQHRGSPLRLDPEGLLSGSTRGFPTWLNPLWVPWVFLTVAARPLRQPRHCLTRNKGDDKLH